MRTFTLFSLCLLMAFNGWAQSKNNFWHSIVEYPQLLSQDRSLIPNKYETFSLQFEAFKAALSNAPVERTVAARNQEFTIALPMPNGQMEQFAVWESSVMSPVLAAKFPEIKSYKGRSIDDPAKVVRFSISPAGFHGAMHTLEGQIYIDPYVVGMVDTYMSYYTRDHYVNTGPKSCGFDPASLETATPENEGTGSDDPGIAQAQGGPVDLYVYKMALSCTAEFAQIHGGTTNGAMEAINTAVNRLNLLYEKDMATSFQLVDNNDELIFTDPDTDPFNNPSNGGGLLGQNSALLSQVVGASNYDIGHVFTAACGGGLAGIAGGTVCSLNKGRGVTCHGSANVTGIVMEVMAHEIGHQFSAGHTWNHCPGIEQQYAAGSAFEPGSGSTILSYSGSCGSANNVQSFSDDYFHVGSLNQMYFLSRNGDGSSCPDIITTNNNAPDLTIPIEGGFHIPISTPFELVAQGSDPDGDVITYCWEQYNTGPYAPLGEPFGSGPIFRSYPPNSSPSRIFPRLTDIINNLSNNRELLPTYSRNLKFRCTVRDNDEEVGGVVWEEVSFEATDQAGPFLVLYPNETTVVEVGSFEEITWDVANTNNGPVNCQNVNILLSLDGGLTYPVTLAENTANDGLHGIVVPDQVTTTARIKVEAADNIFFDISNNDFSIVSVLEPGYSLQITPSDILACPPEIVEIELTSGSLLGFDNPITYSVVNLPAGATAQFTVNNVLPGGSTNLLLDLSDVEVFEATTFQIEANADGTETVTRDININIVNNDFSSLALLEPVNGLNDSDVLPDFTWEGTPNAEFYIVQISTTPTFGNIVETGSASDGVNNYIPSTQLEIGTVYYWRVIPVNICGEGTPTGAFAFRTASLVCQNFETDGIIEPISGAGFPVVTSKLDVPTGGSISDLNVTSVDGEHDIVGDIDVQLISPQGTSVTLFSDILCGTITFDLGFDDQSPLDVPCPPTGGSYKPQDPDGLAKFNGQNSMGEWTLRVEVIDNGVGGELRDFGLEICSSVALSGPELINNNTLFVPPGELNFIQTADLLSVDAESGPEELVYTLVTGPQFGALRRGGTLLWAGQTFTQKAIDDLAMYYEHDGSNNNTTDSFTFTVSDPDGGWLGTPTFNIEIDENTTVSVSNQELQNAVLIYPNPTDDLLNVEFQRAFDSAVSLGLYNIHGQKIMEQKLDRSPANTIVQVNTSNLTNGLYLLQIEGASGSTVKKVTIQK
ncbi:MAG: reprolysin-like metallopeptidase [Bacteroidota bacterium]